MVGRPVHGVEHQRVRAGVDEVVHRAGGHDHEVALGDVLLLAGDDGLAGSTDEGEDLVVALVGLLTDLTARRDCHDHELGVPAGPEHAPEVGAAFGDGGNGEMGHGRHGLFLSW